MNIPSTPWTDVAAARSTPATQLVVHSPESTAATIFDSAASEYADQLERGIALSGESADYFVNGRIALMARTMQRSGRSKPQGRSQPPRVVDFGCGVGQATAALLSGLSAASVIGVDCSAESIRIARRRTSDPRITWSVDGAEIAAESIDAIYVSGVFHHIDPDRRGAELAKLRRWLRPGGVLALFENNPWNPGTRWVMSRIPFDRDAQCLSPIETRRRLRAAGFAVGRPISLFYFPHCLSWLRRLERPLAAIPLGAQYVVFARRPI